MKKINRYYFAVTFMWIGFLLAISFMEAPLKFQAPSVTLAIGVDIGKIVFGALNKVEIFFSLLLIISLFFTDRNKGGIVYPGVIVLLIVAVQSIYLFPQLNVNADRIISGEVPDSGFEHTLYVILEVLKLATLLVLGINQVKNLNTTHIKKI